jgi:hypothetical protein
MSIEIQVTPAVDWMIIPKQRQERIIALIGQLLRRSIEAKAAEGAANDRNLSRIDIDSSLQQWENTGKSFRPAGICVCPAIDHAASRTASRINATAVRSGIKSDLFRLAVPTSDSN